MKRGKDRGTLQTFKNWFLNIILDVLMVNVATIFFSKAKLNETNKRADCGVMEAWAKGDKIIQGGVFLCPPEVLYTN